MEFQILDRMSFGRFLGINLEDDVPDAKTIWLFRDQLTQQGVLNKLFDEFYRRLADHQLILNTGRIINASIVEAPRPRTKKPDGNSEEPVNPNSERQQDTDADWTKKHGKSYFGYKNHIKVDRKSKLIIDFQTTPASVHDSQVIEELIAEADKGQTVYAEGGYL
ncbi:MAG: IS5 family transposase [Bacteroidetes bacterium]|nr:IS5 family transposase [Bacteroidota bacterium]